MKSNLILSNLIHASLESYHLRLGSDRIPCHNVSSQNSSSHNTVTSWKVHVKIPSGDPRFTRGGLRQCAQVSSKKIGNPHENRLDNGKKPLPPPSKMSKNKPTKNQELLLVHSTMGASNPTQISSFTFPPGFDAPG